MCLFSVAKIVTVANLLLWEVRHKKKVSHLELPPQPPQKKDSHLELPPQLPQKKDKHMNKNVKKEKQQQNVQFTD